MLEDLPPLKTANWFYDVSMAQSTKVKTIKLDLSFLQLTEAAEWQQTLGDWISLVGFIGSFQAATCKASLQLEAASRCDGPLCAWVDVVCYLWITPSGTWTRSFQSHSCWSELHLVFPFCSDGSAGWADLLQTTAQAITARCDYK